MSKSKLILYIAVWIIPCASVAYTILLRNDCFKRLNSNQPFELFGDMDNSIAPKNQSANLFFGSFGAEHFRPENSIPESGKQYSLQQNETDKLDSNMENPLPRSGEVYRYGKYLFTTHCVYCHNSNGDGQGAFITKVVPKTEDEEPFPGPPDIRTSAISQQSDARIFHILNAGQNLMYPVTYKFGSTECWAVIRYFRTLQGKEKYAE